MLGYRGSNHYSFFAIVKRDSAYPQPVYPNIADGECPLWAIGGLMHRSKRHLYSITSSARDSSACGTVRPSALAVFWLMYSSTLVACWTGRSAGLSPLRTRPV